MSLPEGVRQFTASICGLIVNLLGTFSMMRYQRAKQARRTKGSASSSWPTATTDAGLHNRKGASKTSGDGLSTAAKAWPTPMAGTPARNGNSEAGNSDFTRKVDDILATWGTPRSSDAEKGGPNQRFGAGGMPLPAQAAQWPTPSAMQDTKGDADIGAIQRREAKDKQIALAHRARTFSPPAHPTEMHGSASFEARRV